MALAPDIVAGVARRLAEHAGLELPAWIVEARTAARIAELEIDPQSYVELIATLRGASELATLVEAVRVGESSLFRHRPQITALVEAVVPALRARGKRAIKVWSAGCATGEEPYTLAAVLSGAVPGVAISVIATDVSAEALATAREATYPSSAFEDVPEAWRAGFTIDGDELRVHPEIAERVTFEHANLVDAPPPRGCDLVWCRNVLIYFSADARRRVIDRLIASLAPGGFLFVGYSETLRDVAQLEAQRHEDTVFYVKRSRDSQPLPYSHLATPPLGTPIQKRTPVSLPVPEVVEREPTLVGVPPPPRPVRKDGALALVGQPRAQDVMALLAERLAAPGIERLEIDLDGAELLGDDLAPVLRRARAAATTSGVTLSLRATKPGPRRWLTRHGLVEDAP